MEQWDLEIKPHGGLFDLHLGDVWRYRDLLMLFVRRDFVTVYKQTVLGPVWFFVQPILTTLTFMIIFAGVARIPTEGVPPVLFYLSGIVAWNYFSECLNKTSNTFVNNAGIFGKVYFPRLVMPLSIVISNLYKFGVQFALFVAILAYMKVTGSSVAPNAYILLTPVLLLIMAGLGLGFGMIISSLTTKYRDFQFLLAFGVQLLMYATPVIYPASFLGEKYSWIVTYNPLTGIIETFRYAYLGAGTFQPTPLVYSGIFMLIVMFIGVVTFQRTERSFIDTV